MRIKKLHLRNFRNYKNASINFSPNINIISGSNGAGKSNILEAIYLLSIGKSFRFGTLANLINEEASYFLIEAELEKDNISHNLKVYYDKNTKKIELNGTSYNTFSNILGLLPAIIHSSQEFQLINGAPIFRRRFLNLFLAQHDKKYVDYLLRFCKTLKHRNLLLKNVDKTISSWEEELALSASHLIIKRKEAIAELNPFFLENILFLSDQKDKGFLSYKQSAPGTSQQEIFLSYKNLLDRSRAKEVLAGTTLHGPHKEDFNFFINEKNSKFFASEGQKKTLSFALRLAEKELLIKKINDSIIFCIDDWNSHFDIDRKKNIKEKLLLGNDQVFLTMPSTNHDFEGKKIIIKDGMVTENN